MESMVQDYTFDTLKGREIVSLRQRHVKHFDLGEGRRQAIIFSSPVHYQNEKTGAWEEIDNRLTEKTEKSGRAVLKTGAGRISAAFARKAGNGPLASIRKGDVEFGWNYEGANESEAGHTAKALPRTFSTERDRRMKATNRLSDSVRYDHLFPGFSVRVSAVGEEIKEDLILENKDAAKYARISLPSGFTYEKNADNSISVLKSGVHTLTIAPPYSYDANGAPIETETELTSSESGAVLSYTIPESCMNEAAYPVTIDPSVSFVGSNSSVETTCINNRAKDKNYSYSLYMNCGQSAGENTYMYIVLCKVNVLTAVTASDTILSAYLHMPVSGNASDNEYICAYEIKKNWEIATATWNSMAADTTEYLGERMLSYVNDTSTDTRACVFDITDAYRKWYKRDENGNLQNYGVALRRPREYSGYDYVDFCGSKNTSHPPYVVVNYVSHAGVKNWWHYETMSNGRAGSAYADVFNGNLVAYHADTATSGSRMPVSVSHVYNSCRCLSDEFGCGLGWRLSLNQTLRHETILSTSYYIWQDGDGTDHFFKISGSQPYSDCEGMQLKLAVTDTEITITDKSDTVMRFSLPGDSIGKLLSVTDVHGNAMSLVYDEAGKLVKAVDGVGRETVFTYSENGLLSEIAAPGCPAVSYEYEPAGENGMRLIKVRYADLAQDEFTQYAYENTGSLLTGLRNFDGNEIAVSYEGDLASDIINEYNEQSRHVTALELKNGDMIAAKRLFDYRHLHTLVTHMQNEETGKVITYTFNSNGNVVDVHDELWHTHTAVYNGSIKNTVAADGRTRAAVCNRVTNIDFTYGWSSIRGNTSDVLSIDSSTKCFGLHSAKIVKGGEGTSSHIGSAIVYESGMYTFSAYVKTSGLTVPSGARGAFITAFPNGNTFVSRETISASTVDSNANCFLSGWQRISVTFPVTASASGTYFNIRFQSSAKSGTVWFAAPQVEKGETANQFNILMNGDFLETVNNTDNSSATRLFPGRWGYNGANITTSTYNCVVKDRTKNLLPEGVSGNALQLFCYPTFSNTYIGQRIRISGAANDVLIIGGWAKTNSVQLGAGAFKPTLRIRFCATSDGSWTSWQYLSFSTAHGVWHHSCGTITAPVAFKQIEIAPNYSRNTRTAMFTNIYMYRDRYGNNYTYDTKRNVTAATNLIGKACAATYDSYNNLLSYVQPGANAADKYTFTYGDTDEEKKRRLQRTSKTPLGVKTATAYDSYGNALTHTIQPADGQPLMKTETVYTENGNFAVSKKDARGNIVTNNIDANGKLLSVTDPAGNTVSYTYDNSNRVTEVVSVNGELTHKNNYTYENDRLKTISHNTSDNHTSDVTYTFDYDQLGRKTTVKVGETTLSTNVYSDDIKGELKEVQYGNGARTRYAYDDFGRLIGTAYDDADPATDPKYEYVYDASGAVAIVKDNELGTKLQNTVDIANRPYNSILFNSNNNVIRRTLYSYNLRSMPRVIYHELSGATVRTEFFYDKDDRVTQLKFNNSTSTKVDYTYDLLNRVTNKAVTNTAAYNTAYTFVQGDTATYGETATTPLVESITQGTGENAMNFFYTYDNRGNIISKTRNSVTTTYEYDALGQLTRVNDPNDPTAEVTGTTWTYVYDRGGNILHKTAYNYTTEALPETYVRRWHYTYADNNWKDKLTAFDSVQITYDAIGNPLNDGTWTYTWEKGRQLKSMHNAATGVTMEFKYNHEGIRTQKVKKVGGEITETTDYLLYGKKIIRMKKGSDTLLFHYDEKGIPIMMRMNGTPYTYVKNLQGDIVGLIDSTGALVVEYKYDAWGNPISTRTLTSAYDALAELNPFRYRGYVLDEETSLFCLETRYYSPVYDRFINSDTLLANSNSLIGSNLFTYCVNNPVRHIDIAGKLCWDIKDDDPERDHTPVNDYGPSINMYIDLDSAYRSYSAYKRANGSAGHGMEWHHIVEQCQIGGSGFDSSWINNNGNIIPLDKNLHRAISNHYSGNILGTGMTVREWLKGKSFIEQYEYGLGIILEKIQEMFK